MYILKFFDEHQIFPSLDTLGKIEKVSSFVLSSSLSCFIVFKYVCILVRFVRCVYFKGCPFFDNDFPFFSVQKEVCG